MKPLTAVVVVCLIWFAVIPLSIWLEKPNVQKAQEKQAWPNLLKNVSEDAAIRIAIKNAESDLKEAVGLKLFDDSVWFEDQISKLQKSKDLDERAASMHCRDARGDLRNAQFYLDLKNFDLARAWLASAEQEVLSVRLNLKTRDLRLSRKPTPRF